MSFPLSKVLKITKIMFETLIKSANTGFSTSHYYTCSMKHNFSCELPYYFVYSPMLSLYYVIFVYPQADYVSSFEKHYIRSTKFDVFDG